MARTMSITTTLIRDGEEIELVVKGEYTPGVAGCRYRSNGDPGDPPEPAEFEILSTVPDIQLSDNELEALVEDCILRAEEKIEDEMDDDLNDID